MRAPRATSTYAIKQGFFFADALLVKVSVSILQRNVIKSQIKKNQNRALNQTICKAEYEENIYLKVTWPDGRLLEYGE